MAGQIATPSSAISDCPIAPPIQSNCAFDTANWTPMMPSAKRRVKYQRPNFHVNLDSVLISHALRIVWESEYKTVYKHALGITLSVAYEIEAPLRSDCSLLRTGTFNVTSVSTIPHFQSEDFASKLVGQEASQELGRTSSNTLVVRNNSSATTGGADLLDVEQLLTHGPHRAAGLSSGCSF